MDVSYSVNDIRFNFRVGAIIIHNGSLLVVKNTRSDYYYSVGGRVKIGETTLEALTREVFEETNQVLPVSRLFLIHENFFTEESTKEKFHEISFYYLMGQVEHPEAIVCRSRTEDGLEEELKWIPIEELDNVRLYPNEIKKAVRNLSEPLSHVITRDPLHV